MQKLISPLLINQRLSEFLFCEPGVSRNKASACFACWHITGFPTLGISDTHDRISDTHDRFLTPVTGFLTLMTEFLTLMSWQGFWHSCHDGVSDTHDRISAFQNFCFPNSSSAILFFFWILFKHKATRVISTDSEWDLWYTDSCFTLCSS